MEPGGILLIDDDQDIREALVEILTEEGYRVRAAEDGQRGLDALRSMQRPCVILLDMMMPVMDGATFLDHLKNESHVHDVPVVVITAMPGAPRRDVAAWLQKPYDLKSLLRLVGQFCASA